MALILFTNAIYFIMGLVYSSTRDEQIIAGALATIYLGYGIGFVVFSWVVHWKMKQIFFRFFKDQNWAQAENENRREERDRKPNRELPDSRSSIFGRAFSSLVSVVAVAAPKEEPRMNQKDYFWGGEPEFVVILGQLMQFG